MIYAFGRGSWLRDDGIFVCATEGDELYNALCRRGVSPTPSFRSHRAKYPARRMLQGISNRRSRRCATEGDELYNALCHRIVSINGSTASLPLEIPQAMIHALGHESWLRDDGIFVCTTEGDELYNALCRRRVSPTPSFRSHRAKYTARRMLQGISSRRSCR